MQISQILNIEENKDVAESIRIKNKEDVASKEKPFREDPEPARALSEWLINVWELKVIYKTNTWVAQGRKIDMKI